MPQSQSDHNDGPESNYGRRPNQDLELWKHYASFGGEDKSRMVVIATWFLGGSTALLWYVAKSHVDWDLVELREPKGALMLSILGLLISAAAAYVAVLYGGYANRNWSMADQIAARRHWDDLLPREDEERKEGNALNALAWELARPCKPERKLARVFEVFFCVSFASFFAHLGMAGWSIGVILCAT